MEAFQAGWAVFDAEESLNAFNLQDGRYLLAIVRDITERNAARIALQKGEDRLRHILEHSSIGIATTTLDGHFMEVNHTFCKML